MADTIFERLFDNPVWSPQFVISLLLVVGLVVYHVTVITIKVKNMPCADHCKKLDDLRADISQIKADIAGMKAKIDGIERLIEYTLGKSATSSP